MRFPFRFVVAACALSLLAGCSYLSKKPSGPTLSGQLNGKVSYRERVALPPDAKVIVSLEDTTRPNSTGDFVAQQVIEPRGQVPISFTLRYIPKAIDLKRRYAITADIMDGNNQLLWSTDEAVPVDFVQQDKPFDIVVQRMLSPVATPTPNTKSVLAFKCDDLRMITRFNKDSVEIMLPGRTVNLPQVVSASGARYTDGKTLFWNKGDEAIFEMNGTNYTGCRVDRDPPTDKPGTGIRQ